MSGAIARRAAAEVLTRVLDRRRTLDEALQASETFNDLEGADRAFARAMASAALRELGRIDAGLAPLLSRPLSDTSPAVRALLRVGAVQLWRMGTPRHAAVSETVEAAKSWPDARSGGSFLNAVLRRAADTLVDLDAMPVTQIWPDWLADRFTTDLGEAPAIALAKQQLTEPPLYLTTKNDAAATANDMGATLCDTGAILVDTSSVESLPGFAQGNWWVQDAAAALPARLLAPPAGATVIDLCAAPGGKTLQLAAMGADTIALDRSKPRLARLRENLDRTGLSAQIVTADAEKWRPDTPASHLLLDAPCSALGTLRRHPEGAWIKTQGDIERFPGVQRRLLAAAIDMLAPGGTLIYCVCTPLRAEGSEIIADCLKAHPVSRQPIMPSELPGFEACLTPEGDVLTVADNPSGPGFDAFYIARLVRH